MNNAGIVLILWNSNSKTRTDFREGDPSAVNTSFNSQGSRTTSGQVLSLWWQKRKRKSFFCAYKWLENYNSFCKDTTKKQRESPDTDLKPALCRVTVMFRPLWSSWWIGSLHAREAGATVCCLRPLTNWPLFSYSLVEARMSWHPHLPAGQSNL